MAVARTASGAIFNQYSNVPYHNAHHGFTVLQGCYWAIRKVRYRMQVTTLPRRAGPCARVLRSAEARLSAQLRSACVLA